MGLVTPTTDTAATRTPAWVGCDLCAQVPLGSRPAGHSPILGSYRGEGAARTGAATTEATQWVQLLPPGEFGGRDGRGPYHVADAAALVAAFEAHGMPLPVDYEHQSEDAQAKTEPTPGAGWIVAIEAREDGVWGQVEWTQRAAAFIAAREYRYLSPVFYFYTKTGAIQALAGAGLTNHPNLHLRALSRALHQESPMDDLAERLRYMLNLPVMATAQELVDHIQRLIDLLQGADAAAETMRALVPGLSPDMALPDIASSLAAGWQILEQSATQDRALASDERAGRTTAEQRAAAAEARVLELEAQALDRAACDQVAAALRARKITPAQADWATSYARRAPQEFAAYVASAQAVPLDGAGEPGEGSIAPDASDAQGLAAHAAELMRAHPELTSAQAVRRVLAGA